MSFKSNYGVANTIINTESEQRDYALMMLLEAGYQPNNSYGMAPYAISNEYGVFAIALGDDIQSALDNAVDENKMDSMLMSQVDWMEYELNEWNDSYVILGNACEPFWSENLRATEIEFH